jgi:hypothetical protein
MNEDAKGQGSEFENVIKAIFTELEVSSQIAIHFYRAANKIDSFNLEIDDGPKEPAGNKANTPKTYLLELKEILRSLNYLNAKNGETLKQLNKII